MTKMESEEFKSIKSDTEKLIRKIKSEKTKFAACSEKLLLFREESEKFMEELYSEMRNQQNEHQKFNSLRKELQNILRDEKCNLERNMTLFRSCEEKREKLTKKYSDMEIEYRTAEQKSTLSNSDRSIMNVARKTFQLYKETTRIKWDYSVPKSAAIIGYVRNKPKNYVQFFEYTQDDLCKPKLVNNLWNQIENGSKENWTDLIHLTANDNENNKENTDVDTNKEA